MDPAVAHAGATPPYAFTDGLGVRRRTTDPARHEPIELLCLRNELTQVPSFEFALRERVSRLAGFRHACYAGVRSVERLKNPPTSLVLVSDVTEGVRLSDLLVFAEQSTLPLDIDAAVCLLRQIVPAVAMLHEEAPDVAHGAIAPERIVLTPKARIVMVEHTLGAALSELQFTRERYWKELRVALPGTTGPVAFGHRSDVAQIGAVALALIVGRSLSAEETPSRLADVVSSSWAISARGGLEPLPAGLRAWLMRALQLDPRESFESAIDAQEDLERVLGDSDYMAAPATLEAFLKHYYAEAHDTHAAAEPEQRSAAASPSASAPPSASVSRSPSASQPAFVTPTPSPSASQPASVTPSPSVSQPASVTPSPSASQPASVTPSPSTPQPAAVSPLPAASQPAAVSPSAPASPPLSGPAPLSGPTPIYVPQPAPKPQNYEPFARDASRHRSLDSLWPSERTAGPPAHLDKSVESPVVPAALSSPAPKSATPQAPSPASSSSIPVAKPADRTHVEPPLAKHVEPSVARHIEPTVTKHVEPPVAKPFEPFAAKHIEPPAAKPFEPFAAKDIEPPAAKYVEPPAAKPFEPPIAKLNDPPAPKYLDAPIKRPMDPPASGRHVAPTLDHPHKPLDLPHKPLDLPHKPLDLPPPRSMGRKRWPLLAAGAVIVAAAVSLPAARRLVSSGGGSQAEGTLVVNTNPPGARLFVDGVERGATPLTVALKPGPHSLEVRGDGAPRLMPVTITTGQQITQYLELPKASSAVGQLHVRTEPAGARVSVDGLARGTSPVTIAELTPGEHAVVLESDFGSVKQTVTIEAGITGSLVVPLSAAEGAPVSGWIAVNAPAEVQLYENRRLIGSSLSERLMVSAGRHEIELVNESLGYRGSRTVQVSPGKVTSVRVDFPKGTIAINALPWAEVWVDGEKVGETPIGNLQLTIGTHDVLFRHPDLGEQRHKATISLTAPARLSVDMRKK